MYAIIRTGGKQYRVQAGDRLNVELIGGKGAQQQGATVTLDDVLSLHNGEKLIVGRPTVANAKIEAEVLDPEAKGKKIRIHKFKRRQGYAKTMGHRQKYTSLQIKRILMGDDTLAEWEEPTPEPAAADTDTSTEESNEEDNN